MQLATARKIASKAVLTPGDVSRAQRARAVIRKVRKRQRQNRK